MNLKDEKMPKVKIVLDNGEGDVQEFEGKGLIFALVDYEEVEEKDRIGMSLNVSARGHDESSPGAWWISTTAGTDEVS